MNNDDGTPAGDRLVALKRVSRETLVLVRLDLDGGGAGRPGERSDSVCVRTGVGFLDHLLSSLAFHAGWSLDLSCRGDLDVDDHHSAEDSALLLGEAFARALALGGPVERFGSAYAPLDEALARAVVDLSGRPFSAVTLGLRSARLGGLASENAEHVLSSFATQARITLHVDVERGENDHHRAEAAFKAVALALRAATSTVRRTDGPGTSGAGAGARAATSTVRRTDGPGTSGARAGERSTKGAVLLETVDASRFAEEKSALFAGTSGRVEP